MQSNSTARRSWRASDLRGPQQGRFLAPTRARLPAGRAPLFDTTNRTACGWLLRDRRNGAQHRPRNRGSPQGTGPGPDSGQFLAGEAPKIRSMGQDRIRREPGELHNAHVLAVGFVATSPSPTTAASAAPPPKSQFFPQASGIQTKRLDPEGVRIWDAER